MKPEQGSQFSDIEADTEVRQSGSTKPVVLVLTDFYLPGFKSGGGMWPLVNMVERFGDDYDFQIVTRDYDGKSDKTPYPNVSYNSWEPVGKARVRYLAQHQMRLGEIKKITREVKPDLVFCNSYFSTLTIFAMLLRRTGVLRRIPVVVAPQGEATNWALNRKQGKKSAFIAFASRLGLYRDVVWRVSSEIEAADVERIKGPGGEILVAPDLAPRYMFPSYEQQRKPVKHSGSAKFVFLSRIHPGKNLHFLLEILQGVRGDVSLDVIGPLDAGEDYFKKCTSLIADLPPNVRVRIVGEVEHSRVLETLFDYHFFVLPTLSENFGYVFLEAMAAGCPIVISDRTMWRSLDEKGIGWDIDVDNRHEWAKVLNECVQMSGDKYSKMSKAARQFVCEWLGETTTEVANRKVFEAAFAMKDRV